MAYNHAWFLLTLWSLSLLGCRAPSGVLALPGAPAPSSQSDAGGGSGAGLLTQPCPRMDIWFSEILFDPEGADGAGDREFIEWMADPGAEIRGHRLVLINGADNSAYAELPLTLRVPHDGTALAGGTAMSADLLLPAVLQNGPDRAELIRDCDGAIVDTISWPVDGAAATDGRSLGRCARDAPWQAMRQSPGVDNAATTDCATFPTDDGLAPDADYPDAGATDAGTTDTAATDADTNALLDAITPRTDATPTDAHSDASPQLCSSAASGWQIHEVLYDPDGADAPDTEFVELRWAAEGRPATVLLHLRHINGADASTLWDRAFVTPGESDVMIVTDTRAFGDATEDSAPGLPLLQNGPDSLQLVDCDENVIDQVAWAPRAATPSGDSVSARAGESIARCADPTSPDNGAFGASRPTPGSPTAAFTDPGFCTAPCADTLGGSDAFISEIAADPTGSDEGAEWLLVAGEPDTPTGRLTVEHFNADADGARWSTAIDGRFDSTDGTHIVGGDRVIPRDVDLPGSLLNRKGRLHLVDCHGRLLDSVGWGYPGAALPSSASGCRFRRPASDQPWERCCGDTESALACEPAAVP